MSKLFLIPNTIHEDSAHLLPASISQAIRPLRLFFVEEAKSARRLLKQLDPGFPLQECAFLELSEHSKSAQIQECLSVLKKQDGGIISESGCPCVADPGSDLVLLAHQNNIEVVPLVGPSSILLALMASGLNGQNFAFNGYLPKEKGERLKKLKELEQRSKTEGQTQIFMDTPYRNQALLEDILSTCLPQTLLCVAQNLTGPGQSVKTQPVAQWKKQGMELPKSPALFLI